MIHRYAYPLDDACQRIGPPVTAADADPAYPPANLIDPNPAKPAKLTTTSGAFVLDFGVPVEIAAAAVLYHNLDHDTDVTLAWNASDAWGSPAGDQLLIVPGKTEDDWTVSPWIDLGDPMSARYWRLTIGDASPNPDPIVVGRLVLLSTLRTIDTDVRWGEEEAEEHGLIELPTALGVETIYALGGKRRRFAGELTLSNPTAAEFIALTRHAHGRVLPWLLIPDASVNDAWIVRFDENRWSRVREVPDINNFPFRVQELSRGLPWP
jgi:hypothetical protein